MQKEMIAATKAVAGSSFYDRPGVRIDEIPIAGGIPFGVEQVYNGGTGIGGAYASWGRSYDNEDIYQMVEAHLGRPLAEADRLVLGPLGFESRQHIPKLSTADNLALEMEVGSRLLREAARANGWAPDEVDGVLVGMTAPVCEDYLERICQRAGIRDDAIKVSVHKACDSSVGALHLALNPDLPEQGRLGCNIARELLGKKVLVGGIEGLSRFLKSSFDTVALQLFATGAGIIGLIPGQTIRFLVGRTAEAFDEKGVLAVSMFYPHSHKRAEGQPNTEVSRLGDHQFRVAGLMHEPDDGQPVVMAGPMGMVKLFVRNGVKVVREVYADYQAKMEALGLPGQEIAVTIAHHANYKINALKDKYLRKEGIALSIPWVVSDFGNVSAASNMIAFLRQLPALKPGDHVLFDGFGAGTYYDVLALALGRPAG